MSMDARRGEGTVLTRPSFDALSSVLTVALGVAEQRADFARARALMVISQTFYCFVHPNEDEAVDPAMAAAVAETPRPGAEGAAATPPGPAVASVPRSVTDSPRNDSTGASAAASSSSSSSSSSQPTSSGLKAGGGRATRLYLQVRVKAHPLFQNMLFWESAVYDSVGSEISKFANEGKEGRSGGGVGGGSGDGGGQKEQDVIFGQLGFFAYNMVAFGVPEADVRKLLDKYAKFIRLDASRTALLMTSLQTFVGGNSGGGGGGGAGGRSGR
jgi:hypothetical protein